MMHALIEEARKSAGISSLERNYPKDNKQRGAGFWAAFLGSLQTQLGKRDESERSLLKENSRLATRVAELEHHATASVKTRVEMGVENLGHQEDWSADKRQTVVKKLAG